jgi:hypothetical protein
MPDELRVEVTNLVSFRNQLHFLGTEFGDQLKAGFLEIAQGIVADARMKTPQSSGKAAAKGKTRKGHKTWPVYASGSAKASIKATAIQSGASIVRGGTAAPYYAWLDWGGSTGRGHKDHVNNSGAIKRPFTHGAGRYVYPAIKENKTRTKNKVNDLLAKVSRASDVEFTGHV